MTDVLDITAEDVRNALIRRAEDFSARKGMALSRMSEEAIKDSKFLANVRSGRNFTLKTYQRMMDWLDEAEKSVPDREPRSEAVAS